MRYLLAAVGACVALAAVSSANAFDGLYPKIVSVPQDDAGYGGETTISPLPDPPLADEDNVNGTDDVDLVVEGKGDIIFCTAEDYYCYASSSWKEAREKALPLVEAGIFFPLPGARVLEETEVVWLFDSDVLIERASRFSHEPPYDRPSVGREPIVASAP
ncbi:MAG TPA: hypothetical protein VHD55_00220 [Candidatus Paceibacterota bacterium]|nr:hypothetical protein [Candidatus Paceibacterota bacterium]